MSNFDYARATDIAAALQVLNTKQLAGKGSKLVQGVSSRTTETDLFLTSARLREASFDISFPAMFSLHGLDIKEAIGLEVANKTITPNAAGYAIQGINNAISILANREYPVLTTAIYNSIDNLFNELVDIYNSSGITDSTKEKLLLSVLNKIKEIFKTPYLVTYYAGSEGRVASVKILHNSFKNLRSIVNNVIKQEVHKLLKENGVSNSALLDSNYLTTKIINWGHTQTADSILTGKLLAEFLSLKNTTKSGNINDTFSIIAKDFMEETGQNTSHIKVSHGDMSSGSSEVLSIVLESSWIQKVKVQSRLYNQQELGSAEASWSIVDAITKYGLLSKFGVNDITSLAKLLLRTRASPSPIDNIVTKISNALTNNNISIKKKTITLLNSKVPTFANKKEVKVKVKNTPPLRVDNTVSIQPSASLEELNNLLNLNIVNQVAKNMGDGSSKSLLNFRTGRLAESVKIERLTISRQGMITAFYSYMRNPYGTFSTGGKQSDPISRDPKLLIAKSIREIAQTKISNRMRSVLI